MKAITKKLGRAVLISVIIFSFAYLSIGVMSDVWWTEPVDMVINMTADWDSIKVNTTTITDRYNQSANTLELDFPYASKDANLVSYWRFENNGNDEVGTNTATVTGATFTSSGKFSGAYSFDGVNDDISVGIGSTLNTPGDMAISVWVYPTVSKLQYIACKQTSTGYNRNNCLTLSATTNGIVFIRADGTATQAYLGGNTSVTLNQWNHIVATDNSKNSRLYLNGVDIGNLTYTFTVTSNNNPNLIGFGSGDAVTARHFAGTIDEVKIYNRSLSASEVATLYNNGKQYIDTNWGGSVSNWTSDAQTITAGNKLKNVTINLTSSATGYIDAVYFYNSTGTLVATNETNIITSGLTTYSTANGLDTGSFDYLNETETFNITVKFAGDGDSTPKVDDIIGYYETLAPAGETYTSAYGVKFNVSDTVFGSLTTVNLIKENFTTVAERDVVLLTSFNAKKMTGGGTNVIYATVMVNGTTIYTEKIRTVTNTVDEGSTGISPVKFTVPAGTHNITIGFNRTGNGQISLNDIDFNLIELKSTHGNGIRDQVTPISYTHSSTNYVPAFNWSINSSAFDSPRYIVAKLTTTATGEDMLAYEFWDIVNNDNSSTWHRWLSSSTDSGSSSGSHIYTTDRGDVNISIGSKTRDGETVTVTGTIFDMDLRDDSNNLINDFDAENTSTSNTMLISGASYQNVVNQSITIQNGTSVFVSVSTSFNSTSGIHTPTFLLNTTNASWCSSKKERYLSGNDDTGNVFIYYSCENLTLGDTYGFNLWAKSEAGETLQIKSAGMSGFEITNFTIGEINLPPIILMNSPLNTTYNTSEISSMWFNVTLNEVGSWCGYSMNSTVNITMTNSTGNWNYNSLNYPVGNHNTTFYCNDTSGLMGLSDTEYFTINDTTVPTFRDNTTTQTYPKMYEPNLNNSFGINCTDDIGIYNVLFESNYTRTLTNYTPVNSTIDIFNYSFIDYGVMNFTSRWICNDTNSNENATESLTFAVVQNNSLNAIQYFNPSPATYSSDYIIYDNFTIRDIRGDIPAFYNYINDSFYDNSSDLVGYWKMDYNGDLYDHSGNSNDGTVNGATYTSSGKFGGAYYFDATDDQINVSDSATLDIGTSDFSISLWFNSSDVSSNVPLVSKRPVGGAGAINGFITYVLATNDVPYMQIDNSDGDYATVSGTVDVVDGTWHHLVFVFDRNGNGIVYVDGSSDNSGSIATTGNDISNAQDLWIRRGCGSTNCNVYGSDNTIDEVKIYNRALSSTEITRLYNSGTGNRFLAAGTYNITTNTTGNTNYSSTSDSDLFTINKGIPVLIMNNDTSNVNNSDMKGYWNFNGNALDSSGNGNDGTLGAGSLEPTYTSSGKFGGAYSFDGGDNISVADNSALRQSTMTACSWIYPTTVGTRQTIVSNGNSATYPTNNYILGLNTLNRLNVYGRTNSVLSTDNAITLNTWQHVCFSNNGAITRLYVNGTDVTSGAGTQGLGTDNTYGLGIGYDLGSSGHYPFSGKIDDVAIFSRSLNADEIKQLYETTIIYHSNNASTFSYSESNEGDFDLTYNFYRNTTSVTSPDSDINAGYYYYTVNTSGGENYTKSSLLTPLSILKNNTVQSYMNLTVGEGTGGTEANYSQTYYPNANYNATGNYTSSVFSGQVITFTLYENITSKGTGNPTVYDNNAFGVSYRYFNYSTDGNINYSSAEKFYNLTITQNQTNPVNLYLNATLNSNKSYIYPESVNATGSLSYSNSGTALLWRDGVSVSNLEEIRLGNATYGYKVNTTGNENYTNNDTGWTYYALVNRGTINLYLALNDSQSNLTGNYSLTLNASAWKDSTLYDEGTQYLSENDTVGALEKIFVPPAGYYLYKTNFTATNYSASDVIYNATITKTDLSSDLHIAINDSETNQNFIYENTTNTTAWSDITGQIITYNLYRNNSAIYTGVTVTDELILGSYNYTYIYNTSGNENYTIGSITRLLNITKKMPAVSLTADSWIRTYPATGTVNCSDSTLYNEAPANLYRNDSDVNATENYIAFRLGYYTHNYTCNSTATANYSSNSTSNTMIIDKGTLLTYLLLNGTQGDKIYNNTDYANLTAWSNATVDTVLTTIYMNVSGTFENITAESIIAENITNLSAFTFANYNITANTTGNENYSSSDGTTYMLSMNDTSSPTINTFSLSASSITLGSSVTITWNVTDNDNVSYVRITSGSQIINSTYAANSTTYTPSSVGTETITLTAFDDSGANVTSSLTLTITAVAITTSSGGGAGGGGTVSNTSFEVIADLISIPLQMSGSTQRIIVIENTGGEKIDFVIDLGTLEEYLILSDTSFSLESGESRSILVGIIATSSPGLTVGRISIIGNGVTKYIPFTMEVESEMVLFDVKLDLLPEYKQVKSGGTLKQQITLFRMTSGELVDVFIHYLIKDMQGNLILEESETFAVQDQRSYTKTIDIPSNLKTGSYVTGIEVRYVNSYAVSSATFDIIEKESILTHTQVTALMLIIGILIVIGIITTFILRIKQTYLGKRSRKARK